PYGSEVKEPPANIDVLHRIGLEPGSYFLFVGRFIPDKGIHLLTEAFRKTDTKIKLVLIGGSPNPSDYEIAVKSTDDDRIIFPGYIYGDDTNILMKNAYAYVQPSLIEGLSPVILTVMALGTPLLCSDIKENTFITKDNAITFESGSIESLAGKLKYLLAEPERIREKATAGRVDVKGRFNWENITDLYIDLFQKRTV
ncbi:MAG: glycosyltransferase family 4 protein, partial [Mucilaginibacter polytrichastri]|nr:glycosyltransferase family 4 protein [Mucilaginibacter polytrichastri]